MKFNTDFAWNWRWFTFGISYLKGMRALVVSIGFLHVVFMKEDDE